MNVSEGLTKRDTKIKTYLSSFEIYELIKLSFC